MLFMSVRNWPAASSYFKLNSTYKYLQISYYWKVHFRYWTCARLSIRISLPILFYCHKVSAVFFCLLHVYVVAENRLYSFWVNSSVHTSEIIEYERCLKKTEGNTNRHFASITSKMSMLLQRERYKMIIILNLKDWMI